MYWYFELRIYLVWWELWWYKAQGHKMNLSFYLLQHGLDIGAGLHAGVKW